MSSKNTVFGNEKLLPVLASTAMLAWGFAFPMVKIGMAQFQISGDNTGGKLLFAGLRFSIAGMIILFIRFLNGRLFTRGNETKKDSTLEKRGDAFSTEYGSSLYDFAMLLGFAFVNTAALYFCFYIGVSNSPGTRASILNSLSTFLLVLLATLIFKEKMTPKKILGCALGLSGILILNLGGAGNGAFTLSGDGMMILNSFCSAFGGILTRIVCRRVEPVFATGFSLLTGGGMLLICGILMGGTIPAVTSGGMLVLLFLAAISVVGFTIYNQLMAYHPVSKVGIYNSLIPVFGVILSCLFLGEPFLLKYILAAGLVAAGVFSVNSL